MAISPPSDILLDVANAADPAKVRLATARLAKLAADPTATDADFGKALQTAAKDGKTLAAKNFTGTTASLATPMARRYASAGAGPATKGADSAYQKFEAVLLQNFVESMLPKDDELYGDKTSAGVYRSMMAEQFANQLTKAGGIGIANAIEAKHPAPKTAAAPVAATTKPIVRDLT